MAHKGTLLKQIVYATAGLSNVTSYVTSTMGTSAATGDQVITDVGLLLVMPTASNVSVQLQDPANTWTAIVAASTTNAVLIPSDGVNMRFHSADTSTTRTANYFVIG